MKRLRNLLITSLACMMTIGAHAQSLCHYQHRDSLFIVGVLGKACQAHVASDSLSLFFARQFLGRPYVAHTLELFDPERLVVNTQQLDCTTLVENVVTLTLCVAHGQYDFSAYLHYLQKLRYRHGRLNTYTSRLHYFTDWIEDNAQMGFVTELQEPNPPFSSVQSIKVNYMSTHPQAYKMLVAHPEFVPVIAKQEQTLNGKKYHYISKADVSNTRLMRQTIHDGDLIAITCNKAGLDVAHLGIAQWQADGLHLLNASQLHKKVVLEPMTLRQYLSKHPTHTGIRVLRIRQ